MDWALMALAIPSMCIGFGLGVAYTAWSIKRRPGQLGLRRK